MKSLITLRKRGLALFLVLTMCLSLLPATAMAEELDAGSDPGTIEYVCGKEEHTHTDACYETVTARGELNCGQEESEGHTHGADCYTTEEVSELTCILEESEEHTHGADCYATEEVSKLTCILEESEGHTHGDGCYGEVVSRGELTCAKDDHTHDETCLAKAEPPVEAEPVCICESKCGGDSVNADCPVCGAEGADLSACKGLEAAVSEIPEAVQAFLDAVAALPALEDIPEKATEAEIEALREPVNACQDAYDALSAEDIEREDVTAAIATLNAVFEKFAAIQVLVEDGEGHFRVGDGSYYSLQEAIDAAGDGGTVVVTHNVIEKGGLTISKPVTIQLDADLTLTGLGSGNGVSLTSSLVLNGSGTMSVNQFGFGFSLNSTSGITIAKGTTLECSNNGNGMWFGGGTSAITVYGTLRCDKNTTDGIYVEHDAIMSMAVDGGRVYFCDQVNDNGIKGSEAFCKNGKSGYQTTVTLTNGAEFHADNNARQGSVYVDYVVKDSELTANENQTGLVYASIISHSGTIKANDNKIYGWQLFEGTPSVIDAQSSVEVKRNGSEAANWGEFYWGAIITGFTNVNLTVEEGANFEVTDNDCSGIRVNYGSSNLTIKSGNISRNGRQNAPNGGGIYIVPKTNNIATSKCELAIGDNVVISDNRTTGSGGGIYCYNYAGTFKIGDKAEISRNTAKGSGGGIFCYNYGGKFTLGENAEVSGNAAEGSGGGIYTYYGPVTISKGAKIKNNTAGVNGGGIYNYGTEKYPSPVTLEPGAELYNNHANNAGDDVYNNGGGVALCEVGSDWCLDGKPDCDGKITGWFYDGLKGDENVGRWNAMAGGDLCNEKGNRYVEKFSSVPVPTKYGLKAAHPDMAAYQVVHTYFVNDVEAAEEQTKDALVYQPVGQEISGDHISRDTKDGRYTYTGGAVDFTLTADDVETPRVITLRYDRVSYRVVHEYYTNGEQDGSTNEAVRYVGRGTTVDVTDIQHQTEYEGADYTYTSVSPDANSVTVADDGSTVITLRYDRVSYRVIHEYYTNGEKDGSTGGEWIDGVVNATILASGIDKVESYDGGSYRFTSADKDSITLDVNGKDDDYYTITLRYDRTVVNEGRYTVVHEYYTNGALDGSTIRIVWEPIGTVISADGITRVPVYNRNTYAFTSVAGDDGFAIVADVNSGTVTLRYDRVSYLVVHEYYTNGALDGSTNEAVRYVNRGTTVDVTAIQRQTEYEGADYTYTSVSPNAGSVTVADDGSTVITLRYNRTVTPPVTPETPVIPPVTPEIPVTPPVTPVTPSIPDTPTPTGPSPVDPGTNINDEDVPLGLVGLNIIDHIAYIIGYEDGTVRPEGNITRAEVATIFFRLMTDEFRTANWSTENKFPDVVISNWFNNAISTNGKANIVRGYMDGEFKPNQNITRAEFAAIAARFLSDEDPGPGGRFSDISGHWAEEEINLAVAQGWIRGYEDGTFRPDQDITRAEAVTFINRMLDRMPDKDHLLEDMIRWPDNTEDKWYYEDMQEATNSHDYDRDEMGIMEVWTEKLEERKWKEFEYEWATAASAPGREVADNLYRTPGSEGEGEDESAPETTGDGEN